MIGSEVLKQVKEQRTADQQFIKWWRKEEDWLDFDRIDTFFENVNLGEEIGGYDLLTMDEMWEQLVTATESRVEKDTKQGEPVILWRRKSGEERVCPYTAESMMTIFDVETHGDYVD